jgi:hypothetical protein
MVGIGFAGLGEALFREGNQNVPAGDRMFPLGAWVFPLGAWVIPLEARVIPLGRGAFPWRDGEENDDKNDILY